MKYKTEETPQGTFIRVKEKAFTNGPRLIVTGKNPNQLKKVITNAR